MVIASLKPLKNCDSYCFLEDGEPMFLTQLFLTCQTVLYCSLLVKVTKPTNMNNGILKAPRVSKPMNCGRSTLSALNFERN